MKICILGAGAYGLALALAFYRNNNQVTVWTKIEKEKEEINTFHQNKKALPNVLIPEDILVTNDLKCVNEADLVVLAIPITFFRSTCLELKDYINKDLHFCIATKGIESETGMLCHEILSTIIHTENIAILSGPTFAIDLANNQQSGLTLATNSNITYEIIEKALQNDKLKLEKSNDLIGVEICGSIKNIMAIIAGMLNGMNTSESTKALFLTEAIQEIKKLITEFGGNCETINTLAGIGDLILTCNSNSSRNFSFGILLTTNDKDKIDDYIKNNTIEGYTTLISIYKKIKTNYISSPLVELLYKIIFENENKNEIFKIMSSI
jgi:glycerol-3-phosphate dehydrogenase (NAD(P)+)